MLKKIAMFSLISISCSLSHADEFYASMYGASGKSSEIKLTDNYLSAKSDLRSTPIHLGIAIGTYLSPSVRADVSANYITSLPKEIATDIKIRQNSLGLMMNGYYDFLLQRRYTPYVMAGVGYAKASFKASGDASDVLNKKVKGRASFAAQIGAGLHHEINYTMKAHLGYRFFDSGSEKVKINYASNDTTALRASGDSMHLLLAGIHLDF